MSAGRVRRIGRAVADVNVLCVGGCGQPISINDPPLCRQCADKIIPFLGKGDDTHVKRTIRCMLREMGYFTN